MIGQTPNEIYGKGVPADSGWAVGGDLPSGTYKQRWASFPHPITAEELKRLSPDPTEDPPD